MCILVVQEIGETLFDSEEENKSPLFYRTLAKPIKLGSAVHVGSKASTSTCIHVSKYFYTIAKMICHLTNRECKYIFLCQLKHRMCIPIRNVENISLLIDHKFILNLL